MRYDGFAYPPPDFIPPPKAPGAGQVDAPVPGDRARGAQERNATHHGGDYGRSGQ